MKTVAQIKGAGFTVKPSATAVGCTDIESADPFSSLDLRSTTGISQAGYHLRSGRAHRSDDGVFRVTVAGLYAEDAKFPLLILSTPDAEGLMNWADNYVHAIQDADEAKERARKNEERFNALLHDLLN